MTDKTIMTASHIRYLLALKRLVKDDGIRSVDIAKELNLSKTSVHNMMDTFLKLEYISKEHGGKVFLTEYGLKRASKFELYHNNLKNLIFKKTDVDGTADSAIYAFLAELSETDLMMTFDA